MLHKMTAKHRVDIPAQWSILNITFPVLFQLNELAVNKLWDTASLIPISEIISLSDTEWERFGAHGLFTDDHCDIFLAMTFEYILNIGISSVTFEIIHRKIASLAGVDISNCTYSAISTEAIIPPDKVVTIRKLRIDSFDVPKDILNELYNLDIYTWDELSSLSEKTLLDLLGFSIEALHGIQVLWRIKLLCIVAVTNMNGLPLESYSSFSRMVEAFVETVCDDKRDRVIILHRIGLIDNSKTTFDEIGETFGLTRERVRQICQKILDKLKSPFRLKKLSRFWAALFETLKLSGGACLLTEMSSGIAERLEWNEEPGIIPLTSVLKLHNKLAVNTSQAVVSDPKSPCFHCTMASSVLVALLNENKDEMTVQNVAEHLLKECQRQPNCKCRGMRFTESYLLMLAERTENVVVEDGVCCLKSVFSSKRVSRVQVAESIFRSAGRPMHLSEVCEELNRNLPSDEAISLHNVSSWMRASTNLLLWDRGTYIHREFVRIPQKLISEIEDWLAKKLNCGVPFVSVIGAFTFFKHRLIEEGVISESALYTSLRVSDNKAFTLNRYPFIVPAGSERITVITALEQYVLDEGGLISYQKLKSYAVKDLCLEGQFFSMYLSSASNILNAGNRQLIHVENIEFDQSNLKVIINHAKGLAAKEGHVSVKKVFEEKQATCNIIGIDNPEILYSLFKLYAGDVIQTPNYPQIVSLDYQLDGENRGVLNTFVEYIAQKKNPCSLDELECHFVEDLGYNLHWLYSIGLHDSIMRYSVGSLIHFDTLDWTTIKQQQLENQATLLIYQSRTAGRYYALVSHLYEYHQLPELGNGVIWTKTLLAELLAHDGKFRVLGTTRNAFVLWENEDRIESFEDLMYEILKNNYEGAAKLELLERDMREAGIIQKRITPGMLGNQERVCISDSVIMLRKLNKDA
jgi:hypothetical protein